MTNQSAPAAVKPSILQTVSDYPVDFTRLLYMLYLDQDSLIRQADMKAQITLGVDAVLIATMATTTADMGQKFLSSVTPVPQRIGVMLMFLMITALLISVYFALSTASPRIKIVSSKISPFFFGSISRMDKAAYIDLFMNLTMQDVKLSVLNEIHAKSLIVTAKFRAAQLSVRFLFFSIVLLGLARFFLAFS